MKQNVLIGSGIFLTVIVVASILNGFVLSILWGWFIVPVFEAPALSLIQAIGVAIVVSYITYHPDLDGLKDDEADVLLNALTEMITYPVAALVVGWVAHLFL